MIVKVYLKKQNEEISYGELWRTIKKIGKKKLEEMTDEEKVAKAQKVVDGLNDLLPTICLKQKTMYYFVKGE